MKIKMISKSIIVIIITSLIILMCSMANYSNANAPGFISFNNAPRKYMVASEDKLADITVRIEDNNGINYAKLYKVDAKGKKTEIKFSTTNTSDKTKHIYTMSHKNMLKGKDQDFYIEAKDNTGNIIKSSFKVVVKSKQVTVKKTTYDKKKKKNVTKNVKQTVKYYAVNDSPRVINWVSSGNNVIVGIKDNGGTKATKIQDMNNNNKEIYNLKNLAKGEARVTLDMTKFKAVNGNYKLKIIATDHTGYQATRTVFFGMNVTVPKQETKKETTKKTNTSKTTTKTTTKTKYENVTTTTKISKDKNVSSFMAALEKISQQVQKDYKAGRPWKYTNGPKSINKLPMKKTFKGALSSNVRTTNCSCCVLWALNECGILGARQKFYGNSSGGIHYTKNGKVKETLQKYATITKVGNKTAKQLIKEGKLKKGDICTYKSHTNAYIGNHKWYDGGRRFGSQGKGTYSNYTFKTLGPTKGTENKKVTYIIRLKDQS